MPTDGSPRSGRCCTAPASARGPLGHHRLPRSRVEVAPTVLQALGVEPPAYMARPKVLADLLPGYDAATGPACMSGMS